MELARHNAAFPHLSDSFGHKHKVQSSQKEKVTSLVGGSLPFTGLEPARKPVSPLGASKILMPDRVEFSGICSKKNSN